MRSVVRFAKWMWLGAAAFWLPDIVWHAIRGASFGAIDFACITILMPLALLMTYFRMRKSTGASRGFGAALVLGVWLLGGFFLTVGAVLSWPGGLNSESLHGIFIMLSLSPLYTYILMFYDYSFLALFVATLGAAIMAAISLWRTCVKRKRTAIVQSINATSS